MADDRDTAFTSLLTRIAKVPKAEIDAEERREQHNDSRRKTPRRAAKPRQIIPSTEPSKG